MSKDATVPPQAPDAEPEKKGRPKSNGAQIASAVIAAAALGFIVYQIQAIKDNNRETALRNRESAARQMFRSQLELEMNNPKLVVQDYAKMGDADEAEKVRYTVFVVHLLYTCEELMSTMPKDYGWHKTCEMRLSHHASLLCTAEFDQALDTYNSSVQDLIRSIRQKASADGVTACSRFR